MRLLVDRPTRFGRACASPHSQGRIGVGIGLAIIVKTPAQKEPVLVGNGAVSANGELIEIERLRGNECRGPAQRFGSAMYLLKKRAWGESRFWESCCRRRRLRVPFAVVSGS